MSKQPERYFEEKNHAKAYARYRISFTSEVVDCIVRYVQDGGCELNNAVDIGCGTGHQSTIPLARVFRHVIGVDISQEQIRQTPHLSNVDFRVGRGEDIAFLESSSVNVVSVATAIHWLDLPAFYKEVDRVLTPRGCLAVYWMKREKLDNEEAQAAIEEFNDSTSEYRAEAVKRFWDRKEIPECPYGTWLHDTSVTITKVMAVEDYVNLSSTMSFWQKYLEANPGSTKLTDYKEKIEKQLIQVNIPLIMSGDWISYKDEVCFGSSEYIVYLKMLGKIAGIFFYFRLCRLFRKDIEEKQGTSPSMEIKYLVNILLCRKPSL